MSDVNTNPASKKDILRDSIRAMLAIDDEQRLESALQMLAGGACTATTTASAPAVAAPPIEKKKRRMDPNSIHCRVAEVLTAHRDPIEVPALFKLMGEKGRLRASETDKDIQTALVRNQHTVFRQIGDKWLMKKFLPPLS